MRQKLVHIIDKLGEASARVNFLSIYLKNNLINLKDLTSIKAQGLKEIITSCRKLSYNDNHRIYLMKDETDNK